MNKLIMTGCLVLAGLLLNAQSWNPYVNQGMFESTPLLPLEFEETGLVSFNFGNTGSSTIEHDKNNPDNNIKIVINLTNGVPDKNNPLAALKGSWKGMFNWSYDEATKTFTGIQKTKIFRYSQGDINVGYKILKNTGIYAPQNGFYAKVIVPTYMSGFNHSADDKVSCYSYTRAYDQGDAPESYGTAIHEINLIKDDITKTYNKYIYLGNNVDQEEIGLSSEDARGDDNGNMDDEDGVIFPELIAGTTVSIPVKVTCEGNSWGILNAWFDWNGDGDFLDAGEKVNESPIPSFSSGVIDLPVTIPEDAITNANTYSRFRIGGNTGPTALNEWGEVEDYMININAPLPIAVKQEVTTKEPMDKWRNEVNLSSQKKNRGVVLIWKTQKEKHTSKFRIERSVDNSEFKQIGSSVSAMGNSEELTQYKYVDNYIKGEQASYRIILVEKDDAEIESNMITEILDDFSPLQAKLYPNPVLDVYRVKINKRGSYLFELIDMSGRIISTKTMEIDYSNGEKTFSRNGIASGQYILQVTDEINGETKALKVIIADFKRNNYFK